MATWSEMREHLVQTYGLEEDLDRGAGRLKGFMPNGYGSDRLVLVHDTGTESTGGLMSVESPVADLDHLDLARALTSMGSMVTGGLVVGTYAPGWVSVRQTVTLANVYTDDVRTAMERVPSIARQLAIECAGEE